MTYKFPNHKKLIYSWDDHIWTRKPTTDDCKRLIAAIILQAHKDEKIVRTGVGKMTMTEENTHRLYMRKSWGLKEDCETIDLNFSAVIAELGIEVYSD